MIILPLQFLFFFALSGPLPTYFDFFADYFGVSSAAFSFVSVIIFLLVTSFGMFKFANRRTSIRTKALFSMVVLLFLLWTFVLSSVLLCIAFVQLYLASPIFAIEFVARLALLVTGIMGPAVYFALRGKALQRISRMITRLSQDSQNREDDQEQGDVVTRRHVNLLFARTVHAICDDDYDGGTSRRRRRRSRALSPPAKLVFLGDDNSFSRIIPVSGAYDLGEKGKFVAISKSVASYLEDDELEAVLAHELGHIKNGDFLLKKIVTCLWMVFPFDPLGRLVVAALYRELEFAADDFSAVRTKNPSSLASALIKIYDILRLSSPPPSGSVNSALHYPALSSISIRKIASMKNNGVRSSGRRTRILHHHPLLLLLEKEPPLETRVQRLLACV